MIIYATVTYAAMCAVFVLNVRQDFKFRLKREVIFDCIPMVFLTPVFGRVFGWW